MIRRRATGAVLAMVATGLALTVTGGPSWAPAVVRPTVAASTMRDATLLARRPPTPSPADPQGTPAGSPVPFSLEPVAPTPDPGAPLPPPPPAPPAELPAAAASPTPITLPDVKVTPSPLPEPTVAPATPASTAKQLVQGTRSDKVFPVVAGVVLTLLIIAAGSIALLVALR